MQLRENVAIFEKSKVLLVFMVATALIILNIVKINLQRHPGIQFLIIFFL